MDGVRPVADMLDRFNAISAMMATHSGPMGEPSFPER